MSDSTSENAPSEPKQQDAAERYIVDKILPAYCVHLWGGPSGAGKTTLLIQFLEDWSQGKPVFGYDSFPRPFLYMPADRSEASFQMTRERMNCTLPIPIYSLVDHKTNMTIETVITKARQLVPDLSVLIIDAIGTLVPGGKINDYGMVGSWLRDLNRLCDKNNLTIIGIGHSAKVKEGEGYNNPRQRFLGSVAWGGFADTMIFIEPSKADDPTNPSRNVIILPRNAPDMVIPYHFNKDGRLVDGEIEEVTFMLAQEIKKLPVGTPYPTQFFVDMGERFGISRRTTERWLMMAVAELGILERVKKGFYRRPWKS